MDVNNTWKQELEDINVEEMLEVFVVNMIAPFILNTKLKPLMAKPSFILNVSSMEGVFHRTRKSSHHSHTNMAKAALNMMTRTAGLHY